MGVFGLYASCPFRLARWIPRVLLMLVAFPVGVAAQCDVDKEKKASAGANGYRRIDATLCEGIYGQDVSGDVLTLVALTEPAYLETYEPVGISWSSPGGLVHVRAHSWAEQAFQMDAGVPDATTLRWPVDLLRNENIPLDKVGLLGWVEADGRRLYLPLRVSQEPDPRPERDYVVQILPNARLSKVSVTLAAVGAAGERPSGAYIRNQQVLPQTSFAMASAFEVWISHAELPSPGVYFLEILAMQDGGSTSDTMTLWFHHGG